MALFEIGNFELIVRPVLSITLQWFTNALFTLLTNLFQPSITANPCAFQRNCLEKLVFVCFKFENDL